MHQKKHITIFLLTLLSVLTMGLWTSCDKYNSESVGSTFFPSNSLVRLFTHPVYVEFRQDGANVWGPYANEVDYSIDGTHVSLTNASDSLALFVYGIPAVNDSAAVTDCNLVISGNQNYALYINKFNAVSQTQPVITSLGTGTCFMVLPKNSKNSMHAVVAASAFEHHGTLVLTGEGELSLTNDALYHRPSSDPAVSNPAALVAQGGLHCQYDVKLSLSCPGGDAIRVSNGPMRSSLGTWTLNAGHHAISNHADSIVLIAGTYTGIAREGKFFDNKIGAVVRQAKVEGLSGQASDLLDTLLLHQHYDSTFVTLQQHLVSVTMQADSSYSVSKKNSSSNLATFKPIYSLKEPWVILTNSSLQPADSLDVK